VFQKSPTHLFLQYHTCIFWSDILNVIRNILRGAHLYQLHSKSSSRYWIFPRVWRAEEEEDAVQGSDSKKKKAKEEELTTRLSKRERFAIY
jgi:hypothetical protein